MQSKTMRINRKGDLLYLTFPAFSACPGVRHAFTTRFGGASTGEFSSMNMSFTRGDARENVLKNYETICRAIGVDEHKLVLSHQTHTKNLRAVTADDAGKGIFRKRDYEDVDGLMTDVPGLCLVTQYADCTPLFFCDPVKRVVALSHSGWRGTVLQIGKETVITMGQRYGCRPENILAGIGPSIGPCCYEVDDPVVRAFSQSPGLSLCAIFREKENGKYWCNLWEANRQILLSAGILPEHLSCADLCTNCHPDWFFSHRFTGGKRGNLAALIALEETP